MARTAIAVTDLPFDGGVAEPAGTNADPTNGMFLDAGGVDDRALLVAHNTAASAENVTVRAGNYPPASQALLGDLVTSVAAGGRALIGPLSSARFAQADGTVNVDLAAGFTGTLYVVKLAKG